MSWSQINIVSIERTDDIFCSGDAEIYKVTVEHQVGDVPIILQDLPFSNQNFLNIDFTTTYPKVTVPTQDTTIFKILVTENGNALANSQNDDTLWFEISDNFETIDTLTPTVVYGTLSPPTFDLSPINLCSNGLPIDLNQYVSPVGGEFSDINGNPISNVFSPSDFYNEFGSGSTVGYVYTNSDGCMSLTESSIIINIAPTVTPSTTASSCGSATGTATVNITPGTATGMMEVYWSTGFLDPAVSSTSSISNLSSGVYYANVTDTLGCKAVGTAQVSDADMVVTNTVSAAACEGMTNGVIDLTITGGGNITQTFWSNGVTTEDMVGPAGEYSVEIHTDNNCNAFGTYIIPENSMSFSLAGPLNPVECVGPSNSFVNIDTASTAGISSVVWTNSIGTTIATTPDFTPPTAGVYTCTLTDNNGCTKSWDITLESFAMASVYPNSVTKENCGLSNGAIDVEIATGPIVSYAWSNGATTQDLVNVPAGDYTLEYVDNGGCSNFLTVTVPNVMPYQPQICVLTVDTSLTYNKIIWEKDPNNIVDGFKIYRETTNYGEFELVATIPYSSNSEFIDNEASPNDRSWRYFITSFDGCGESYGSFIHKTIHVVIENTDLVTYNLSWDDYEGINYTSVDLWRYEATNGWQIAAANLPVGTNTYADVPSDNTDLNYMVSFNLASTCTSTKAIDHNASRSNNTNSIFLPGGDTDLSVIENEDGRILMYPNPTTDFLNISIENSENYNTIRVVNINGQLIYEQPISNSLLQISTQDFPAGIYFVQIYSENSVVIEKIVKN